MVEPSEKNDGARILLGFWIVAMRADFEALAKRHERRGMRLVVVGDVFVARERRAAPGTTDQVPTLGANRSRGDFSDGFRITFEQTLGNGLWFVAHVLCLAGGGKAWLASMVATNRGLCLLFFQVLLQHFVNVFGAFAAFGRGAERLVTAATLRAPWSMAVLTWLSVNPL
jgi:hypothetical protein